MTAPAIPAAAPTVAAEDFSDLNAMERTIQSTLHESQEFVGDEPIENRPRNAQGQFVSVAEGGTPATKPATDGKGAWNVVPDAPIAPIAGEPTPGTIDGTDPAAPEIPEGFVAPATLPPERVQGFKVLDAEGEIVPPDLRFEVNFRTADGQTQARTLDLPKLVNYARQGVYNHERDQQHMQLRTEHATLQQTFERRWSDAEQTFQQMRQDRDRLLSDGDYLMREIQAFEQQNTPDARVQREREQRQTAEQKAEFVELARGGERFVDGELAPALQTIMTTLPTVTQQELATRLAELIAPYKVQTRFGTIINPQSYQAVRALIVRDLVPWAQQVHLDRDEQSATPAKPKAPAATAAPQAKPKEVVDAQTRAQKARRLASTPLKPAGGTGRLPGPSGPTSAPKTNRGMEEFIVSQSVAGMGRGG